MQILTYVDYRELLGREDLDAVVIMTPDQMLVHPALATTARKLDIDCEKPICPVETGHRTASVCHLGDPGYKLRCKLAWNPAKKEFPGDAESLPQAARWPGIPVKALHRPDRIGGFPVRHGNSTSVRFSLQSRSSAKAHIQCP